MDVSDELTCFVCNCALTPSDRSLTCSVCKLTAHTNCTHLDPETISAFEMIERIQKTSYWTCRTCKSFTSDFIDGIRKTNDRLDKIEGATVQIVTDINDVKKDVFSCKTDLASLNTRLTAVEGGGEVRAPCKI